MKKVILFLLIIFVTKSITHAQITITASDFASQLDVGKTVTNYSDSSATTADIGSTGSTSWDFSGFVAQNQFVTESKNYASSQFASDFPTAQYASFYEGIFDSVNSQTWVYSTIGPDYYTDGTGTIANIQGYNSTVKVIYNPKKTQFKLPLTYNSTWTTQGTQSVQSTISIPIVGDQTTTLDEQYSSDFSVDAYGQVKMPDGKVLDALRVKEVASLTYNSQTTASVTYHIVTKTGESVSIPVLDQNATSGTVAVDGISWTSGEGVTAVDRISNIPTEYSLNQNYPNPFNPSTEISFSIPKRSFVSLKVYDITGREIENLVNKELDAGTYSVDFNGVSLASGVYFYQISANGFIQTRKMLLAK